MQNRSRFIVGKDSGINSWADLKGKRVNIGNPGSGQRGTFEALMLAYNVDGSYFGNVTELTPRPNSQKLFVMAISMHYGYTVGVPMPVSRKRPMAAAPASSLSRTRTIARMVADRPYYAYSTIPKGTYKTINKDVDTFGVMATIVASCRHQR